MHEFNVDIFPDRTLLELFGHTFNISDTVIITWGIIGVMLVFSLLFRLLVVPRMKDNPRGIQLLMEIVVENLDKYVDSKVHGMSLSFGAYIFSVAVLLLSSAFVELVGLHAPTADLSMTIALALMTFVLVNYYGFKRRGLRRFKSYLNPFNMISDLVAPLSLACRLFGNMFAGVIIIGLLYYAMGSAALVGPAVAGLYFNVFHPLIQAFIFITLTLSYISEASGIEGESS